MKQRTDPAAAIAQLIRRYGDHLTATVRVAIPCKVVTFDEAKMTALVQPLIKDSENPAPVTARVLSQRFNTGNGQAVEYRSQLVADDTVMVLFCDREIKNAFQGRPAAPDSARRHSLMDGVVIGVFL